MFKTFYYKQTVELTLEIQAETAEEADAIANATDITDPGVIATEYGWEEDGYTDA
jgi:hypothetical protein